MTEQTSSRGGIGFSGLLGIVFITLKLTHTIDWPWWLVLAPLWLGFAFIGVVFIAAFIVTLVESRS